MTVMTKPPRIIFITGYTNRILRHFNELAIDSDQYISGFELMQEHFKEHIDENVEVEFALDDYLEYFSQDLTESLASINYLKSGKHSGSISITGIHIADIAAAIYVLRELEYCACLTVENIYEKICLDDGSYLVFIDCESG